MLSRFANAMLPLIPPGTDVLAGLEMGGIPIVAALSRVSGVSAAFIRKTQKAARPAIVGREHLNRSPWWPSPE